jgi:hypothetical protein
MNMQFKASCATSIVIACLLSPAAVLADAHNPLKDASFEDQLPAEEGGWGLFENSLISDSQARTGNHSMYNGGLSKTVAYHPYFIGNVSGSFQEFPAQPGSRWRLTGYGMVVAKLLGTPAFGVVQLSFFDADGNDLGTVETVNAGARAKTSNEVNNQSPVGEWIFLDTGIATAPEGTSAVQAFTIYVDFSGSNTAQGVYFDDLTLCAVSGDNEEGSALCDPD